MAEKGDQKGGGDIREERKTQKEWDLRGQRHLKGKTHSKRVVST